MFINTMFLISAAATVIGAFLVAVSKNLMHACIYLLLTLFGVAGLYATLGADFLAATQLVVYAGGVVILMLFAIMLTGGIEQAYNKLGIKKVAAMGTAKTYSIAAVMMLVISFVLMKILAPVLKIQKHVQMEDMQSTVEEIGTKLITDHVLAFEISSILLLGALVGAAVISRPRRLKK
ncbi:NADH-ubiquinone/plastoquinone oxidoreductase chain 6 [Bacteriovorax sp. BAL6_X]|uniref:NADH-quinone oxidoreductase subunit J family protein n=1 Tax=Bacteriovorax sp. BAL6_X TaxID=1201290 RepID=UPI0003863F62|nr:NADH-quinone oxidoreductase subunit J [Bacteriovorax sp. BAL6_X]EPZ50364.1 NADH-ubiquinone/plastoquinone oxidoreductase chain 6 [Bacteriovorax sp. BAL6_X]